MVRASEVSWPCALGGRAGQLGDRLFRILAGDPANRIGHKVYSAAQLKTIQEVVTLSVFVVFSVFWLKESISWTTGAGFMLIAAGAALVFRG